MPNEQNLIPNSERTPMRRKAIARSGGIASGVARREKKTLRELAKFMLSMPETDKKRIEALKKSGLADEDLTNAASILLAQFREAKGGDTSAATYLGKVSGQMDGDVTVNVAQTTMSKEEAYKQIFGE